MGAGSVGRLRWLEVGCLPVSPACPAVQWRFKGEWQPGPAPKQGLAG